MGQNLTPLNYFRIFWNGKWVILLCMAISFSHGLYTALKMTKTYQASTNLILEEAVQGVNPVTFAGVLLQSQSAGTKEALLMSLIFSKRMAQDIAEHFIFSKRYGLSEMKAMQKAFGMVKGSYVTNMIYLTVVTEDPQLTVEVSYFIIKNIQHINEELDLNPTKELVKILDPPELSLVSTPLGRKRIVLTETFFGFVFGAILVFCWNYALVFWKAKIQYVS